MKPMSGLASELAEQKEMPRIVCNLSADEATVIMADSNLQREKILPSEKAFAYAGRWENGAGISVYHVCDGG